MTRDPRPLTEDALHASIVDLLRYGAKRGLIFFHIPNGMRSDAKTGARFVKLGLRAGAPDLCLVLPNGTAAFMEIKTQTGRVSLAQKVFRGQCAAIGVPYAVVRSFEDAEHTLRMWGVLRGGMRRAA